MAWCNQISAGWRGRSTRIPSVVVGVFSTLGMVAMLTMMAAPTFADPPAPSAHLIPTVTCFRITDIEDSFGDPEGDKFDISVQFTNWSPTEVFRLRIDFTNYLNIEPGPPIFSSASLDPGGRPIGPASDDANYPPGDGTAIPPMKVGAVNLWAEDSDQVFIDFERVSKTPGLGVRPRDIIGVIGPTIQDKIAQSCALVPGCELVGLVGNQFPNTPDLETVDNAGPSFDGGVDNSLDGFVMTLDDFDPGDYVSINWRLLDQNDVTVPGPFSFGVLTLYRQISAEDGEPLWFCVSGCSGSNTGTTSSADLLFDNQTSTGATFQAEVGLGIIAPFRVPGNNIFNASPNVVVPEPGISIALAPALMMLAALRAAANHRRRKATRALAGIDGTRHPQFPITEDHSC